jgi:hypothetical protein
MKETINCERCGGSREHDLATGEVLSCDVCGFPEEEEDVPDTNSDEVA